MTTTITFREAAQSDWTFIQNIISNTTFVNNLLLIMFFFGFAWVFYKENKDDTSPINWTDLLVDFKTGKVSLTKLGQFWGIAISSWVVVLLAQTPAAYSIFPMVFPAWLAFLAGSWAFSKYVDKDVPRVQRERKEDRPAEKKD